MKKHIYYKLMTPELVYTLFSYIFYQLSVCYNVNAVGRSPTRPKHYTIQLSLVQQHHSKLLLFSNQILFKRTFTIYLLNTRAFN